jgi:hypothetical protein
MHVMLRWLGILTMSIVLAVTASAAVAPAALAKGKAKPGGWPAAKAGKGEKVCRYKFPTGEKRAWVCKKEEPCCAWDAINYVKCGSTITGCL